MKVDTVKKIIACNFIILSLRANPTHKIEIPAYFGVNFHTSMEQTNQYRRNLTKENNYWKRAKELYNRYIIDEIDYSQEPRIPKIIHMIWLGSPLPEKYKAFQETWMRNHPDWGFKLWTDNDVRTFGLINQQQYDMAHNYGEKSDILRYEILYRIGGLYVDTDFECLKPFDIFNHTCDFYAGLMYEPRFVVQMALIGSRPGHPILKKCIQEIQKKTCTSSDTLNQTGPYFFTRCIEKYLLTCSDRTVLFPVTYFYPWPHWKRHENTQLQIEKWFKPETYAVHHWHTSWQ